MNLEQTARIISHAAPRLAHHRQQVATWYATIATDGLATPTACQHINALLGRLTQAYLAVRATGIADAQVPNLPPTCDLERMVQDVDHLIAALNTTWHRVEARAKTLPPTNAKRAGYIRLVEQVKTARTACLRLREAALLVTPLDYRPDEITF